MTLSTTSSRMRLRRSRLVIPALCALMACEATPIESAAGRHVVVHWDPDESILCGGTIAHVDASLEIVAKTYGVSLPPRPNIEIFWTGDASLVRNSCMKNPRGCTAQLPNGNILMIIDGVTDGHELSHAIGLARTNFGLPSFFAEGVAVRWEHGLGDIGVGKSFYISDVTYAEVRDLLDRRQIPPEGYTAAGFLWSWLEAKFGPATMKEFAGRIDILSSPAQIEREFEATFGITLEMATEASWGQPLMAFDPHACSMELPTQVWAGDPLALSSEPSTCASADVVNTGRGPGRYSRLELPDVWQEYSLELSGRMSAGDSIYFYACRGEPLPFEEPLSFTPTENDQRLWLRGTYIMIAIAPIEQNGDVLFPSATLKTP
jgi:hypothetical protein